MWQPVNAETERPLTFPPAAWPILIHGAEKSGASLYTVMLTAMLVRRGLPVVFICAHSEAIRALQTELGIGRPSARSAKVDGPTATALEHLQLIAFLKRQDTDILGSLRALRDWSDRVVVVKNAETILTPEFWETIQSHRRLIVSGDFNQRRNLFRPDAFRSTILFSEPPGSWGLERGPMPTYVGVMRQGRRRFPTIVREQAD